MFGDVGEDEEDVGDPDPLSSRLRLDLLWWCDSALPEIGISGWPLGYRNTILGGSEWELSASDTGDDGTQSSSTEDAMEGEANSGCSFDLCTQ